jgi:hypothetical protein
MMKRNKRELMMITLQKATDITYIGGKYRGHTVPDIRLDLRAAWEAMRKG